MRSSLSILIFALPFLNAASTGNLGTPTTQNGLTDGTSCKALTVIFARGTTEQRNVGTLTGPPFFASLAQSVGIENFAVQGVDYPADTPGFSAGWDANRSKPWPNLCSGQGGQLVHNAAKVMNAATTAKINSAVIFGDPDNGTAAGTIPASNTLVICHAGDNIYQHGDQILQPHLTYSMNAGQAANFVASAAGMVGAAKVNGAAKRFVA